MEVMTIASRIAQARQQLKMTQQQLAERLCVTNKAVSKWERGACVPDVSLLVPLCRILGMSVQELLDSQAGDYDLSCRGCISADKKERTEMPIHSSNHQLYIDLNHRRATSPYIWGHNLEHTRACVSEGLSAQMLRNRKFAGRPSRQEGISAEWFGIGNRVFYANDGREYYTRHYKENGMWRRNETQAQNVQNLTEGQVCGIGQRGLCIQASHKYTLTLTVKCSVPVVLTTRLTDWLGNAVYAETKIQLEPGEWIRREIVLESNDDDDDACLRLTFTELASVIFGAVSMLPEGHFRGMRRDVVEKMKELGISLLRWPGGNFAGEYRWLDMLLPVDMRAPLQAYTEDETQPYTHGYDMHEIDTDDFIALCREIGADPFITINLQWSDPEENAAWVEYCNGAPDTKYGKLRAARGHAEPYHVQFWSLGNEMGYGHMEGPMMPERYAALARQQAEAMLKISPDLQLFSSGLYPNESWVEKSARTLAPTAPYISFHAYNTIRNEYTTSEGIMNTYLDAINAPMKNRSRLRELRAMLPEGIHISFDEWNCWTAWFRRISPAEGMYTAEMLHMMLYESEISDVPVMCYFQPVGEGAINVYSKRSELTANGQAFSLLKAHRGGELCHIDGLEDCEAVATLCHKELTISMINVDYAESALFSMNRCGTILSAKLLTASDLLPGSRFSESNLALSVNDDVIRAELPARSVAVLRISPIKTMESE